MFSGSVLLSIYFFFFFFLWTFLFLLNVYLYIYCPLLFGNDDDVAGPCLGSCKIAHGSTYASDVTPQIKYYIYIFNFARMLFVIQSLRTPVDNRGLADCLLNVHILDITNCQLC